MYRLICHELNVPRTSWWKDEDRMVTEHCWRTYGPGLGTEGRVATDIEIDVWQQKLAAEQRLSEASIVHLP